MIMQAVYTLKNFHYGDSIASAQGWDIQKLQNGKSTENSPSTNQVKRAVSI